MKYDITKPMGFKVGMYDLNKNTDYNFQLGRLVNMDGADLKLVRRIADKIHDNKSWKSVLLRSAVKLDKAGDIKNAMAFYRMAEFFMEFPANNINLIFTASMKFIRWLKSLRCINRIYTYLCKG